MISGEVFFLCTLCLLSVHSPTCCLYCLARRVDPYEPNRVWFTIRTTGTHTVSLGEHVGCRHI